MFSRKKFNYSKKHKIENKMHKPPNTIETRDIKKREYISSEIM